MTNNPLARRRAEPDAYDAPPAMSAQQWCDQRNASMHRDDIEWFVTHDGQTALRDRADWQAAHTRDLARKAEADRRDWMHRQNYPVTAVQEAAE